jgi:hypothetical protein
MFCRKDESQSRNPRVTAFYAAQPLSSLYISVVNMPKFASALSSRKTRRGALN